MPLFKQVRKPGTNVDQSESLFRYCPEFSPEMRFEKVLPYIEDAEAEYIRPMIGDAFFEELQAAYDDDSLTPGEIVIVRMAQKSIAWFTFALVIQSGMVRVSDMGPHEQVSSEGTAISPRQWVSRQAQHNAFTNGYKRLHEMMRYLDGNAASYGTWELSEAYARNRELLFRDPDELSNYLPTRFSYPLYMRLRPSIALAETRYIRPALGVELYEELKLAHQTDTLNADLVDLLHHCRQTLAAWAMKFAVPFLRLSIDENGMVGFSVDTQGTQSTTGASGEQVRSMWVSLHDAGTTFLAELRSYLIANAGKFSAYQVEEDSAGAGLFLKQEDENGDDYSVVSFM